MEYNNKNHQNLGRPSSLSKKFDGNFPLKKRDSKIEQKAKNSVTNDPSNAGLRSAKVKISPGRNAFLKCEAILKKIKDYQNAKIILNKKPTDPDDIYNKNIYLEVVEQKLQNREYKNPEEFEREVKIMFNQGFSANVVETKNYQILAELTNLFDNEIKGVENVPFDTIPSSQIPSKSIIEARVTPIQQPHEKKVDIQSKNIKPQQNKSYNQLPMDTAMTKAEKAELKNSIMRLSPEGQAGILAILRDVLDVNKSNETLEFDIDTLPPRKCRELEKYVKTQLSTAIKKVKGKGGIPTIPSGISHLGTHQKTNPQRPLPKHNVPLDVYIIRIQKEVKNKKKNHLKNILKKKLKRN